MRKVLLRTGVALFVALSFAFPAQLLAAEAQTAPLLSAEGQPASGPGCAYRLEHLPGSMREARIASITCFNSLADSLNYVAASPMSSYVLGIDWDYPNRGAGDYKIWYASGPCTSSVSWAVSYVGAAWDNRTASAEGDSNCNHFHHYENPNYGGAQYDCNSYCATMGVMTDQTSSESWDP
jgi:hypothetical protein